jgi:hypothetical protein
LEGNSIHPWEGVDYIVDSSRLFQFMEEAIGTESNVLVDEGCIDTHEVEQECFADEAFFDLDGTVNNHPDADRARRFEQAVVDDTGKVTVKSFIADDSSFAKHRPGSTPCCLNKKMAPSGEEDAFNNSKGDEKFGKQGML